MLPATNLKEGGPEMNETQRAIVQPAGSRMGYWIATVLRDRREAAGISEQDAATTVLQPRADGKKPNSRTIKRLETGATMPSDLDQRVAGYAYLLGLDDPRELWREAMDRWDAEGTHPVFIPVQGPAAAFAEAIRMQSLRRRAERPAPGEERRATR